MRRFILRRSSSLSAGRCPNLPGVPPLCRGTSAGGAYTALFAVCAITKMTFLWPQLQETHGVCMRKLYATRSSYGKPPHA